MSLASQLAAMLPRMETVHTVVAVGDGDLSVAVDTARSAPSTSVCSVESELHETCASGTAFTCEDSHRTRILWTATEEHSTERQRYQGHGRWRQSPLGGLVIEIVPGRLGAVTVVPDDLD